MIAAGVFDPAEAQRLELIGGELHMISPIGERHADAVDWLVRWSMPAVDPTAVPVRGSDLDVLTMCSNKWST